MGYKKIWHPEIRPTYGYDEIGIESHIAPSKYSPDDVPLKVTLIPKENSFELEELVMNSPIFGAAMDTVTAGIDVRLEYRNKTNGINIDAAKIISKYGGIPVFPRSREITPKIRVEMLRMFKRSSLYSIVDPITILSDLTIKDVVLLTSQTGYSSFPVVNEKGFLQGMLSRRDYARSKSDELVKDRMTPLSQLVVGKPGMGWKEAFNKLDGHIPRVEKLPLVDEEGLFKGLTTIDNASLRIDYPTVLLDSRGTYVGFMAIGPNENDETIIDFLKNGANGFVIDASVGRHINVGNAYSRIDKLCEKHSKRVPIVAGNVVGKADTKYLIDCGVPIVKVGYGGGYTCSSGNVTATAKGTFSSNIDCVEIADEFNVSVIADSGFRVSGHAVIAAACGVKAVMLGKIIAEGKESPVIAPLREAEPGTGFYLKIYRGMGDEELIGDFNRYQSKVPEGMRTLIPIRGSLHEIMPMFLKGVKSGISDKGFASWEELVEEHKKGKDSGICFNLVSPEKKTAEGPVEKIPLNASLKL